MTDSTFEERPPQKLGPLLRAARRISRLSQKAVIDRTSIKAQSALSRMEQDPPGSVPTSEQAVELANLYQLPEEWRDQLVQLVEDHYASREEKRFVIVHGTNILHVQRRFRRLEEKAKRIRAYSSGAVTGFLQSPAYVRAMFGGDEEQVAERLRRGANNPQNNGRNYEVVLTEGTAFPAFYSYAVMADQFDHLVEVSRLPNVNLRWIGRGAVLEAPPGLAGFYIYDDHTVILSQVDGAATLDDPEDIARYAVEFERLQDAAVGGNVAREALAEIAAWYRERT